MVVTGAKSEEQVRRAYCASRFPAKHRRTRASGCLWNRSRVLVRDSRAARFTLQARQAARKYARIIQKLDFPARFTDFKIQNMVRAIYLSRPAPFSNHTRAARHQADTSVVRTCHPATSPCTPVGQVGSCDVKFPIRLEGLAYKHSHYSSYEPELFPGLIYRMVQPKIVLLIFVSGKVVLTGGKVRNEIYSAFDLIYPVLQEFRKQ